MAILKPQYCMATAPQFVGRELGASDWVAVDQNCIDAFAACTGDRQWIHVDVERARRESPFGVPIAHGYLTLALAPAAGAATLDRAADGALVYQGGSPGVKRSRLCRPAVDTRCPLDRAS